MRRIHGVGLVALALAGCGHANANPSFEKVTTLALHPGDRVYTADQTSNTVSVVDPNTNRFLGQIVLGNPRPDVLSPLYRGELNVHGLGYSPDHKTLDVISTGSNSATLIDTTTNRIKGTIYLGRAPHEGFFTPDGRELWVAVRGEDYISVIDPVALKEVRRIEVANGPSMVLFSPSGDRAYVNSSFTPEFDVIDTRTYRVIQRVAVASPFSPNLSVSPDGKEVWFTHKDIGKTSVFDTRRMAITAVLDTGKLTNHVKLVDTPRGAFAYVTVGGLNVVKVFRRSQPPELVATIPVGDKPHGVWNSEDGSRVYIGLEDDDALEAIDTTSNHVIGRTRIGQAPQALVYVSNAVSAGDGTANLARQNAQLGTLDLRLRAPEASASGTVLIRPLGALDSLDYMLEHLQPDAAYGLYRSSTPQPPYQDLRLLASARTNSAGTASGSIEGPIREIVHADAPTSSWWILVRPASASPNATASLINEAP